MASSLFTDSSCLLLVEVQPLLRGVLYRAAKAQSKGEKGQFPFPADCPHLYFCLRSAMRVGTETKHKGQTGNWPKLQGKCSLWCLESQGVLATLQEALRTKSHPSPKPLHRLLPWAI